MQYYYSYYSIQTNSNSSVALLLVPLSAPVTAGIMASVPGAVVAGTAVVMVAVVSPSVVFRSSTPPWNKATNIRNDNITHGNGIFHT
jgi:hypothetical protein